MGKITVMNYAVGKMFQIVFDKEAKLSFVAREKVAETAVVRCLKISNQMVLTIEMMGYEDIKKMELAVEYFLLRAKSVFASLIGPSFLRKWKLLTINHLRKDVESVMDLAHEDSEDLFYSFGKLENLNARAIDLIANDLTVEDIRVLFNQDIFDGKRVIYENLSKADKETDLPKHLSQTGLHVDSVTIVKATTV
jgi:hypothetical protein